MPSVSTMIELFDELGNDSLTVHQERCVVVRNRNATCTRCADACTSGCIVHGENELSVNPENCIGCGTCATACPTSAIELAHPTDKQVVEGAVRSAKLNDGLAVIACEQVTDAARGLFDPDKVVSAPCVGRIDESMLATMAAAGVKGVRLTTGRCEECDHAVGLETAKAVVASANAVLEAWRSPMRVELSSKLPASTRMGDKGYDAEKRRFFSGAKDDAEGMAVKGADVVMRDAIGEKPKQPDKYEKVGPDGTLPHFVPDRRRNLMSALDALGEPDDVMVDTRMWGNVVIDADKCSSCRMCAVFSPTGAIRKFDDDDGEMGVLHTPADCVKCRCCVDICPSPGAIELSDEVFARDVAHRSVQRYPMHGRSVRMDDPHQILNTMKGLLGSDQVYEG